LGILVFSMAQQPVKNTTIAAGEAHFWEIPIAVDVEKIPSMLTLFSDDEVQRANRFHFEKDRTRFIAARAAMRQILAGYVNIPPQQLVFLYGAQGKPELPSGMAGPDIRFNLSHSRDFALLAVTHGQTVGVDIEYINRDFAREGIAERFFSPHEVGILRAVPPDELAEAFFCCWTRKEAYIKALGKGFAVPLNSFDVAFGRGVTPALLRVEPPQESSRWSMYAVTAPAGYTAAAVIEGHDHHLQQHVWVDSGAD
jgi:4'-phosphopantetheinyl transferase